MNSQKASNGPNRMAVLALAIAVATAGYNAFTGIQDKRPDTHVAGRRGVLETVKAAGRLRAGYVVNSPQVTRDAKTGKLGGFAVELLDQIGSEGGFTIEYEETTFSTMLLGLRSGKFDIVVGGGYGSIPRAMEMTFSEPFLYITMGYVARADDSRFATEADLKRPGIRVAVTAGGASADYVKQRLPDCVPVVLSGAELARVVLEVIAGKADVALNNSAVCQKFEKEHPNIRFVTKGKPFFLFPSGFVVRQGDPDWLTFLNTAIRKMQVSGYTQILEAKYNPDGVFWLPVERH